MQSYLIFTLTSSLGAMGELAGHERRGSLDYPGRSAIIGFLGAAMGIDRGGDFSALDALDMAVAIFDTGTLLRDYHTFETVPGTRVKHPNSRPESLREARKKTAAETTITLRDYRVGAFYGVAVWGDDLDKVADFLNHPHYTLYLGRKSCPLSAPPGAMVVEAETAEEALTQLILPPWRKNQDRNVARTLICGSEDGEIIHDVPINRGLRHFTARRIERRDVNIEVMQDNTRIHARNRG
ncbi:MAG: type I-E CRISPR-associated protein Cas5/CasD [Rhodobacteraceae bacterium]|nr:type I-E CRISPR-associated protein Cas5/CasD [Paracoccaceae bacterium]